MINFFADHSLIQGDYNLKRIKVIQQIGRGNSHVFSIDLDEEIYAMKQIQIKNDYEYQSFLKEISLMKDTAENNPFMIKYYGYFVTAEVGNRFSKRKYAHIIMQCAQMNLQNLITVKREEKKQFTKAQVLTIVQFMIAAFDRLQRNKIAHCDIKPQNILVLNSKTLQMKLCDVGSCRIINNQIIEEATIFGTVPFLAPELIHNKSNKTISANPFKSDVYSFGLVILYTILFKKFSFKERKQVDEGAYYQIISDWIREAMEKMNLDSRISEVLRQALEFDEYKRPLFREIKQFFESQKKRKRTFYELKLKKLMDLSAEKNRTVQEAFRSTPVTKLNLFKSRNLTTKISNRTVGVDFPKIQRNNSRGASPLSPAISPLSKRKSSCYSSSPQKDKANLSMLEFKKIIYITQQDKDYIPYDFIDQQDKNFVLFIPEVRFKKAQSVTIMGDCSLSVIYHLADVDGSKLYLEYEGNQCVSVGEDVPLLKFRKVYVNLSQCCLIGGYTYLLRSLCGIQLEHFQIKLNNSDISFDQVLWLIQKLNNRALKTFVLIWQNIIMNSEEHFQLTEKISKLSVKKLIIVMNKNFIKYQKQSRWLLPKNLETLYLQFQTNFLDKIMTNLCISIQDRPLKQLFLNLCNNNINKGSANFLIKTISSLNSLEKLIIDLSMNPIEDISYMTSALVEMKNISSLDLKLNNCNIEPSILFQSVGELKYLFDQKMKILKISYDRNMKKMSFHSNIEEALDNFKGLKLDIIPKDNKCFTMFIKKKGDKGKKGQYLTNRVKGQKISSLTIKPLKDQKIVKDKASGNCPALYNCQDSYEVYQCLLCCDFRELSKKQYFCKHCIEQCEHKGHNIVRIYERKRCCCAYSHKCTSDITKKICGQLLYIKQKMQFECYKCEKKYCDVCITRCLQNHKGWVDQSKDLVYFKCGTSI